MVGGWNGLGGKGLGLKVWGLKGIKSEGWGELGVWVVMGVEGRNM